MRPISTSPKRHLDGALISKNWSSISNGRAISIASSFIERSILIMSGNGDFMIFSKLSDIRSSTRKSNLSKIRPIRSAEDITKATLMLILLLMRFTCGTSMILLSSFPGDGDFESLLKYLKAYKKRCIILSTKSHVSIELIRQAKFIDFKKIKSEIAFP